MKFDDSTNNTGWIGETLHEVFQPGQAKATVSQAIGQLTRRGLAVVLSALMIMIPMGQSDAFAQAGPPDQPQSAPPPPDANQPAPQGQPLAPEQLDQLVAPIALYPDALVAQVLTAATYPTQVVEADRWRQSQGNAPAEQIAAAADSRNWDPSVKALVAFPTVLSQMDRNLQWTTDLGNAYYNQPQDVMDAVQAMRQKAQAAGQLRTTQQQTVSENGGVIQVAPANPAVVYVPVYNPWVVYGAPFPMYPGYYYYPPPGIFWGGLAIGFGIGIGIGLFAHFGWGWGHWGMGWGPGWGGRGVFFNHSTYITRSTTVINRGFNRPGGPPRAFAGARGSYARPGAAFNRPGGAYNRASVARPGSSYRGGANNVARPGGNYSRPGGATANRPAANYGRSAGAAGSYSRSSSESRGASAPRSAMSRPSSAASGGARPSGGSSHSSGGGHSSGGSHGGGGHSGGGGHGGHGR